MLSYLPHLMQTSSLSLQSDKVEKNIFRSCHELLNVCVWFVIVFVSVFFSEFYLHQASASLKSPLLVQTSKVKSKYNKD